MRTELCLATAIVGILLAVWPKSASAEATSLPVLNKALDTVGYSDVGSGHMATILPVWRALLWL